MDIPTLSEINDAKKEIDKMTFEQFRDSDDIAKYADKIYSQLTKLLGVRHDFYIPTGGILNGKEIRIFRAREITDIKNPFLKCEYSYPPPSCCKSTQRANLPYCPVFYGSDNGRTAIRELVNREIDESKEYHLAVSAWKLTLDNAFRVSNFLIDHLDNRSIYFDLSQRIFNNSLNQLNELIETEKNSIRLITNYFGELFLKYDHTLSAAIAYKEIYSRNSKLVMYPSIQMNRMNINLALHPNIADKYLELDGIINCTVKNLRLDSNDFNIEVDGFGFHAEDQITFTNNPEVLDQLWPKIRKDLEG